MNDLTSTIASLRQRRNDISNELGAIRDTRGAAALQAATSGNSKPLDDLDKRIAALEREAGDIDAALGEAARQHKESKDRAEIEKSKAAVKALPAIEKKLRADYAAAFKAIGDLIAAVERARQTELEAGQAVNLAVPYVEGVDSPYSRQGLHFRHMRDGCMSIVERALSGGDIEKITADVGANVGAIVTRVLANADIRQQAIEQKISDQRTGRQPASAQERIERLSKPATDHHDRRAAA